MPKRQRPHSSKPQQIRERNSVNPANQSVSDAYLKFSLNRFDKPRQSASTVFSQRPQSSKARPRIFDKQSAMSRGSYGLSQPSHKMTKSRLKSLAMQNQQVTTMSFDYHREQMHILRQIEQNYLSESVAQPQLNIVTSTP